LSYLVDTNVISELRKGPRCDPGVAAWFAQVPPDDIYLSVLTVGEIRKGIENIRRRNEPAAEPASLWPAAGGSPLLPHGLDRGAGEEPRAAFAVPLGVFVDSPEQAGGDRDVDLLRAA
jgi:hypothetical protein